MGAVESGSNMMSQRALATILALLLPDRAEAASLKNALGSISDFDPLEAPEHTTHLKTGLFMEHLLDVDFAGHTFAADFYWTLEWEDGRNYSSLFTEPDLVESEAYGCNKRALIGGAAATTTPPSAGNTIRFVEFGHQEIKMLWTPDVHITNQHGDLIVHEELMRVYEDGHIEFLRLVWAQMDLHSKVTLGYPVDKLLLEIHIASLSATTKRITQSVHPTMDGLETLLLSKWSSGWGYVSHHSAVHSKVPIGPLHMHTHVHTYLHE